MKAREIATVIVVLFAMALLGPSPASAGWYFRDSLGNYGWLTIGTDDPSCIWYRGRAACSGWNYWHWNDHERRCQDGTLLIGFENNERIRGDYSYEWDCSDGFVVAPFYFNMGGYLIAHGTHMSGSGVESRLHART